MKIKTPGMLRSLPLAAILFVLSAGTLMAQAGGAVNPSEAVRVLVGSLAGTPSAQPECNSLSGQLAGCPISERLRSRLGSPAPGVETGNLVSRSQNPPSLLEVAQVKLSADATVANVDTRWVYGALETIITFVVVKQGSAWVVDDSYCQNNPASSIYSTPVGPCPSTSTSGGAAAPGMPRTGGEATFPYSVLLPLGLLTLVFGLLLGRMGRNDANADARSYTNSL